MRESAASAVPANINPNILTFDPSQLTKFLHECREIRLPRCVCRRAIRQHADAPHPLRLLRVRSDRPRRRAAEQRDEGAAFHSITCSARAISIGGTVRRSALAALRLMNKSNLVGCWT